MWGEIQFCWNYIDEVIDFILSTGAKPLLEFGHMPLLLAKNRPGKNDASGAKQLSARSG